MNFPWNKLYRTAFLRTENIRFPDLRVHEDIRPHWQSCLRAERFAVLNWAPPLVHHFELGAENRATDYMGPDRKMAFDTMAEVYDGFAHMPHKDLWRAELVAFAQDLLRWMCQRAPQHQALYEAAATRLFTHIKTTDHPMDATVPGAIL